MIKEIFNSIILFLSSLFGFNQTEIMMPNIINTTSPTPTPFVFQIHNQKILQTNYHTFQTFNNCGPASLSMTLYHYGINVSQKILGDELRPYQIANGDNDDKSVTLSELAEKARDFGFTIYHRPNGNMDKVKKFISYDIPVVTRTITKAGEDIGHFRVVKGYDESQGVVIQDDSLQGKDLKYSYIEFERLWQVYNFEYLVLIPQEKESIAKQIIGDDIDEKTAWQNSVKLSELGISSNPDNINNYLNLSVALYHLGDYQGSINAYESVASRLPMRTLWYQIEPIKSYYEVGNYQKVFEITDRILNGGNRAFSEAYLLRGEIYKKQGNLDLARSEFEKAVFYNKNLSKAQEALNSVNSL